MKIAFEHIIPDIFASKPNIKSDIWLKDIQLDNGYYLIEAESGSGKSSLFSFLIGQRKDYQGNILYNDNNIRKYSSSDWSIIRKKSISCLFQELRLFPELTAWENVEIKNQLTCYKTSSQIQNWFERLGIADKCNTKVANMSFGQQQRVALIRSLCQPFELFLADEPISHLDDANAQILSKIILEESISQGATVIITSIGRHPELPYNKKIVI